MVSAVILMDVRMGTLLSMRVPRVGELGHLVLDDDGADDGHAQEEPSSRRAGVGARGARGRCPVRRRSDGSPPGAHEVAEAHDHAGGQGQLGVELLKMVTNLGKTKETRMKMAMEPMAVRKAG